MTEKYAVETTKRDAKVNTKGHLLCKQCLHALQFMKKGSSSPNLSKLARADISCQLYENKILVPNCLHNEWTLPITLIQIFVLEELFIKLRFLNGWCQKQWYAVL